MLTIDQPLQILLKARSAKIPPNKMKSRQMLDAINQRECTKGFVSDFRAS